MNGVVDTGMTKFMEVFLRELTKLISPEAIMGAGGGAFVGAIFAKLGFQVISANAAAALIPALGAAGPFVITIGAFAVVGFVAGAIAHYWRGPKNLEENKVKNAVVEEIGNLPPEKQKKAIGFLEDILRQAKQQQGKS